MGTEQNDIFWAKRVNDLSSDLAQESRSDWRSCRLSIVSHFDALGIWFWDLQIISHPGFRCLLIQLPPGSKKGSDHESQNRKNVNGVRSLFCVTPSTRWFPVSIRLSSIENPKSTILTVAYCLLPIAYCPLHFLTSFARASNSYGTVKPICFAAGRLMMNSNLIACSIGKSAGLAPFKILST